jgi:tetratricopeptide (TPR) repeat protein
MPPMLLRGLASLLLITCAPSAADEPASSDDRAAARVAGPTADPEPAFADLPPQRFAERQVLDPNSDEWVDRVAEADATPTGELETARKSLATGDWRAARRLLKPWVKANRDHERYAEAEFLLGETYYEGRDYYTAYEHYEIVVENTSGDLYYATLRREMDVARAFFAGAKRWLWGFLPLPAYDDGFEILDKVWQRVPGTRMGEEALKLKADFRFQRGELDLAQDEYAGLAREYPNGRYVQGALLRAAESAEAAFSGIKFDDRPLVQADERYRQLQRAYPAYAEQELVGARLDGIQRARAEKDFDIARWYERTRQRSAAAFYYREVIRSYPGTVEEAQSRSRLRALGFEEAEGETP